MHNDSRQGPDFVSLATIAGIAVAALVLRIVHIDAQLWIDEISALNSMRRGPLTILTEWPGTTSHQLFELLTSILIQSFGDSPWILRSVAVFFGVAGVLMLYILALEIFDHRRALVAAALLAVSYHHVFFSQNARGYTTLIFFALLASWLFLRIDGLRRLRPGTGIGYALSLAATGYAVPFGAMLFPAHGLLAVIRGVTTGKDGGGRKRFPLVSYLAYTFAGGVLLTVLYAPLLGAISGMMQRNAESAAEGPRLGWWLVQEVVEGLSSAFGGPVGLAIVSIVGLFAVYWWWRESPFSLFVLTTPLVLLGVALVVTGMGIHPRYFATALPVVILIVSNSLCGVVDLFLSAVPLAAERKRKAAAILVVLAVLVSCYPLKRYYSFPKQDFVGALGEVEKRAAPGDIQVGIQVAGTVYRVHYETDIQKIDTLEALLSVEAEGKTIWLVTTLERLVAAEEAALMEHIRKNYEHIAEFGGTVEGGTMHVYSKQP